MVWLWGHEVLEHIKVSGRIGDSEEMQGCPFKERLIEKIVGVSIFYV